MWRFEVILGFLEFLYILGVAGSCELGNISISDYLIKIFVSLLISVAIRKAAIVITSNNRRRVHNEKRYKRELHTK